MNCSRLWAATHILRVNFAEMGGDRLNNLRMKFSALNVDFNSLSPDPLRLTRPARECQKGLGWGNTRLDNIWDKKGKS